MNRLIAAAAIAAFPALAACEQGTPEAGTTNIQVPTGGYQAELEAMPEGQRNAVFIRAIRDADLERTCQGVESSTQEAATSGSPTWRARCTDGSEWLIIIGGAGIAQVVSAAEAQAAGIAPEANSQ